MCIDYNYIKRKFYTACNSILTYCKHDDEMIKLQLVKLYCQQLLSYYIGTLYIANRDAQLLGVSWNDAYRKIFGYNRWESVRDLQIACGQETSDGLYVDARRRFLRHIHASYCQIFENLSECVFMCLLFGVYMMWVCVGVFCIICILICMFVLLL